MSYHLTPVRVAVIKEAGNSSVGEDVERGNPSGTVGGIVDQCGHCGKQYECS